MRRAIEVLFFNAKRFMRLEDPPNRLETAVKRTAPFGLVRYSVTVLWFHQEGHRHARYPERPWYRTKREPSFADMLRTLRRIRGEEFLRGASGDPMREKARLAQLLEFLDHAARVCPHGATPLLAGGSLTQHHTNLQRLECESSVSDY